MAETISGSEAAGSASDSWSARLCSRLIWRLAIELNVHAGHQRDHVAALHLDRGDVGHRAAVTQHDDPVGQREDLFQVVRGEQHAGARLTGLPQDRLDQRRLGHAE